MINLFDTFDNDSADFLRSQIVAGFNLKTVVITDNGFLPENVDSPIKYYCGFKNEATPLYFDKLPVPAFWRITANNRKAEVFDVDRKRADIFYTKNDNSRWIKEVHWLNNGGGVQWIDHFNQNGKRFAQTFYDNGQAVLKKYYDAKGQAVIIHHLLSDDVELNFNHEQRHFNSIVDFVIYFLEQRKYNLDHILYNTLNKGLFTSLGLKTSGIDSLFWHEPVVNELPGNMKYLMDTDSRTKHIYFQRYNDWLKYRGQLQATNSKVDFHYLGMIYPHPRGNKMRQNALILTNSDQIEHLTEVVESMPTIHFNIAALTEMSKKLMAFKKYDNVDLYPCVELKKVKQLMHDCDVYFDINHQDEILDAVRSAFEQNMLIVGFNNTIHNPQFISQENIFKVDEINEMKNRILKALSNVDFMWSEINRQRREAGDVSVEDYQKTMKELQDEK